MTRHTLPRWAKAGAFTSATSMLNFYINRAGKNLSSRRKEKLNKARDRLRELYYVPKAKNSA